MRGRAVRALLFIAMLSVFAADISVGCGRGAYVSGPVSQKYNVGAGTGEHLIMIESTTYEVPTSFFVQVQVGDVVKFNGREWTIVKRAGQPAPAPTP